MFGYSPSIGAGNLIFSVAAATGTDPYGNSYPAGVSISGGNLVVTGGEIITPSLTSGSIGSSSLVSCDYSMGTIETTTITFDSTAGYLVAYATTTTVTTFTATGQASWTAPGGVTSVQVECWGAGGGGAWYNVNLPDLTTGGGGGGGGGAYAMLHSYTVVPGNSYTYNVATHGASGNNTGGAGGNGGGSWWVSTSVCLARGGIGGSVGGTGTGGAGGRGGLASTSVGDVTFSGGSGGNADYYAPGGNGSESAGGGGGSSAGTSASGNAGGNASGTTGGAAGIAPAGGGDGGTGGSGAPPPTGTAGVQPGGGGGGASGGAGDGAFQGADGQVRLTYTTTRQLFTSISPVAFTDSYGNAIPAGIYGPDGSTWTAGGINADTWHSATTGFPTGWTGTLSYEKQPSGGLVAVSVDLAIAASTAISHGETIYALPAGYYSTLAGKFVSATFENGGSYSVVPLQVTTAGHLAWMGAAVTTSSTGTSGLTGDFAYTTAV